MAGERNDKPHWSVRLQKFDRRWVFLAMAVAILVPFIWPCNVPYKASPMVKSLYYTVEELKPGDEVFVSFDYDPASMPELQPFVEALMLQLKRKNVKMVFATTWYSAPPLVQRDISELVERPIEPAGKQSANYHGPPDRAYVNNKDFVWLGFREGREAVISAMGNDLWATFDNRADDGTPLAQIPMMQGRKQLKDFDLVIVIGAGYPGVKEYVQQVQGRYNLKMVGACTAVSTTEYTPYYQAGQLLGLSGGMAGSAEYELLVGRKATAAQGNDVLNAGYLVVILAIIFGNIIYFVSRKRPGGGGR